MNHKTLLTTKEVAGLLRVHPKHVYRLMKGGLPALRVGAEWRYSRESVLQWAAANAASPRLITACSASPESGAASPDATSSGSSSRIAATPAEAARVAASPAAASLLATGLSTFGSTGPAPAGLIAANGDWAVEILLAHVRQHERMLLGLVVADHAGGRALLHRGRVLAAGSHGALGAIAARPGSNGAIAARPASNGAIAARPRSNGAAPAPSGSGLDSLDADAHSAADGPAFASQKLGRLQIVTREVGLAVGARPFRRLQNIVGKRIATRPVTAGLRQMLDAAVAKAGIDPTALRKRAVEYACHRDVTLAVARGEADVGLTTRAWAHAAGLAFFPMASEEYELCFVVAQMGDPRIVALCEVAQTGGFRRELRRHPGYGVARTGQIAFG